MPLCWFYTRCGSIARGRDKYLNASIVGMAATPDGAGYWLVAEDGGVFTFGDAPFYGSAADYPPAEPVNAFLRTGLGEGYWLNAADGTIRAAGGAAWWGDEFGG